MTHQIEKSISELFASAINKESSPMQCIEDDSCDELVVYLRADDLQDFVFISDIDRDTCKLTITEYSLEDKPITLSSEQLAQVLKLMETMYIDSVGDGCDYPYDNCQDHGMSNSDFQFGYSA